VSDKEETNAAPGNVNDVFTQTLTNGTNGKQNFSSHRWLKNFTNISVNISVPTNKMQVQEIKQTCKENKKNLNPPTNF